MTVNQAHAIQTTLGEQLNGPAHRAFIAFRNAHMAAGNKHLYNKTYLDLDHMLTITVRYDFILREHYVKVRRFLAQGPMYTLRLAGLDTQPPEWGDTWIDLARKPELLQAVLGLFETVKESVPVVVNAL